MDVKFIKESEGETRNVLGDNQVNRVDTIVFVHRTLVVPVNRMDENK